MIETMESQRHATDGDLIRLLDADMAASGELAAHVAECRECGDRLSQLRRRSERLAAELRATDLPPVDPARIRPPLDQVSLARLRRRRRAVAVWSRPGLRAAAALLLLAGVAAASPAARGWIMEGVGRLRGATRPAPRIDPAPPHKQPGTGVGARVWFTPTDDELVIRFETPQAGGTLELVAGDEPRSSAQIVGDASNESLLVLPSELRIRNTSSSVASYRVVLSPSVRHVRVDAGDSAHGGTPVDVTPGMRRVIPLGTGTGRGDPRVGGAIS
jgi:hypothetical protein